MKNAMVLMVLLGALSAPLHAQTFFEDPSVTPDTDNEGEGEGAAEEPILEEAPDQPLTEQVDADQFPVSATYPPYRIRYLADLIDRDRDGDRLIEEGVFNTVAQANEVINILAHLTIAGRVNCSCEEYRRDVVNATFLENQMMELMAESGYISRLVPSSQVAALPAYVGVISPYLTLNGDGYRDSNHFWSGWEQDRGWWNGWGGAGPLTSTTLNPANPNQYARVDFSGIFVDTRLSDLVDARVRQIMGGYRVDDPASLCAFAALERPLEDMMSWVLIRDQRRTWTERAVR